MATKTQTTYTMTAIPQWYTNYGQDIIANQAAVSSRPFAPYDYTQRVAGFTPTQQQGFEATQQNAFAYQPTLNKAQGVLQGTLGRSSVGAMQPYVNQAQNPLGLAMAQPYLSAAGQSSAALGAQYMNPYIENVVNRFGELGARTLQEQLMPAIQNKYIQAGQLGGPTRAGTGATGAPSGMMTDAARALRDVQEGVLKQQQQALAEGWNQATGLAAQDLGRMGQLASTAGNLGYQQQQIMANLASQIASAYGQDTANQLTASGQLAQMAQQMQQQGLAGASAITGVGNQQQALDQALRDARYAEFLRESGYDQAQIDSMLKTYQGVGSGVPQGQIQTTTNKGPSGSLLGSVAGAGLSLAGSGALGGRS